MSISQNQTPVRIPKLAVRNRTSSFPEHADRLNDSTQEGAHDRPDRPVTQGRDIPAVQQRTRRPTDASASSASSSGQQSQQSRQSQQQAKKKKGGVFGFLTLKEPSSSAWDEYAALQKKGTAARGGRNTTVGMPGISSQKLPDHVPKVNSKWDGLPDEARKKAQQLKERNKSESNVSRSSSSTYQSYGTSGTSEGTASQRPRNGSSTSVLQSQSSSSGSQKSSSQTSRHQDLAGAYAYGGAPLATTHPALRASYEIPQSESPPPSLPDLPGLDLPELADFEAAAFITTSEEPSPLTPQVEDPLNSTSTSESHSCDDEHFGSHNPTWPSDAVTEESTTGTNPGPFTDSSIISTYPARPSTDFGSETPSHEPNMLENWPLRAPEPPNRPSPISTSHRSTSSTSTTNTALYTLDSSTAPTFPRDADSDITRPTTAGSGATVRCGDDLEPARSNSDTSIAPSMASTVPSVMSAQWQLSPKERLGLGGKMRKSEVLPWEAEEGPSFSAGGDRKTAPLSSKKGRLSTILGRR